MTELLVGTKKRPVRARGTAGEPFAVTSRAFAGEPVSSQRVTRGPAATWRA